MMMNIAEHASRNSAELFSQAKELYSQWRLNEVRAVLDQLFLAPGKFEVPALNLYADTLWSLGDVTGATRATEALLSIAPLDHQAARRAKWLGLKLSPERLSPDWVRAFAHSGERPSVIYPALVRLLNEEGRHDLALATADEGLATLTSTKSNSRVINKLILEVAIAKENLGDYAGAVETLESIDPALPVAKSAALSLSRMLHEMGHFPDAEEALSPYYDHAQPAFNVPRYHIYLSTGRIREAFELYRSRRESEVFRRLIANYAVPPTDFDRGAWTDDSLLVLAEGGPGDELRMSSLYGEILAHAKRVTFSCDPRLESLFSRTYPEAKFEPSPRFRDELRKSDYSARSEIRDSLGAKLLTNRLLGLSSKVERTASIFEFLANLRPNRATFKSELRRYLVPDPALVREFSAGLDPSRKHFGLAWRSMINNSTRQKHYFAPEDLMPLREIQRADFWILQPDYTAEEITYLQNFLNVRTVRDLDLVNDFESQAALISCLDAVIAPCTTTAELAGAVGVETIVLANTHMTAWRQNSDGSDIWHPRGKLVLGDSIGDRHSVITNAVKALSQEIHLPKAEFIPVPRSASTPLKRTSPLLLEFRRRFRKFLSLIPGARRIKRKIDYLVASNASVGDAARQAFALETRARNLLRHKIVKPEHIVEADAFMPADSTGTMLAVKAALQARAGDHAGARYSADRLSDRIKPHPKILPAIRTEMADLGRHDLAVEGLRLLLAQKEGNRDQAPIRMGNAAFEREAYDFLSNIPQPRAPKGYVIIFGLNNRVTLGLMTPLAWRLAKDGYHVSSSFAAAMRPSELPELRGISGAIRWSGLSLTDEPSKLRALRNDWRIDLPARSVECDGINYFTFFAERLGKLSNSYAVDMANPKVFAAFESLLQRSDIALSVCKRILALAKKDKPIRIAAMDTHFAPAGIVRQWCQVVGRHHGIELVALSISYENYYSNLTSLEAKTISIENLTRHSDIRHPLFGGRKRFESFMASTPNVTSARDQVLTDILVNRSKTEDADAHIRAEVSARAEACHTQGGMVFATLGKVLIDFAAPYDSGHTFSEFSDWIGFLVSEVADTQNLLIIKPHPHEVRSEIAAPGVQTLRDLLPPKLPDNVVFLDHAAFNSHELADLVDLTFVWNGTAYTEFPVLGKPVVAESVWAEKDYPLNGKSLTSMDEYRAVLRGERVIELSEDTVRRATAFLQFMKSPEVAIPFGYVRRAGTNRSIGSISFIRDDMDTLTEGRNPGLELAASRFFEPQEDE